MPRSFPPVSCRESEVGQNDTEKAPVYRPAALAHPLLGSPWPLGFALDSRDYALFLVSVRRLLLARTANREGALLDPP